jgi:predicted deacylase
VRQAVFNALRQLGMWAGALETEAETVAVIERHTLLTIDVTIDGPRGMVFMDKEKRGRQVQPGETLGIVRDPFTGAVVETIRAPRAGVMLYAGAAWPMLPEGSLLAILGDLVREVSPQSR